MSAPVDILTRARKWLPTLDREAPFDAETVRLLCDEIAAHRLARDTMAPGVAERLTRYRAAALGSLFGSLSSRDEWGRGYGVPKTMDFYAWCGREAEKSAHAMLAAEREPEVKR